MLNSVRDEFMNDLRETQNNVKKQKIALNSQIKKTLNEIDAPSESASLLSEHIAKSIRLNPDEKTLIKLTNAQTLLEEFNKLKSTIGEVGAEGLMLTNIATLSPIANKKKVIFRY